MHPGNTVEELELSTGMTFTVKSCRLAADPFGEQAGKT
jgi:hypothetical protein